MLDFRINTFLTVCKTLNFTKASDELHITQPAVSQHIHYLEKEYGTKLFTYEGKKLTITPSGHLLRQAMEQILHDESKLKEQLTKSNDVPEVIRFGVTMTIGEFAIVEPLSRYLKSHPDTNLHIVYGNTATLLQKLHDGEIDFAIVEGYFSGEEYASSKLQTEEFIAVCSHNHHFDRNPQTLSDLFTQRLLIREPGSGTRNILERALALENYTVSYFKHYIEIENMHTIIQLLSADCGITFLYKIAVADLIDQGILQEIPLKDFKVKHDFTFLWEKNSIFADRNQQICHNLHSYSVALD